MPGMRSIPLEKVIPLMASLPLKYQAICAVGVTTGCRISEILALRRFDLINSKGELKQKISFLKLKSKSGRILHRTISIPEAFRPILIRHLLHEEQLGYDRPDDCVFRGQLGKPLSRLTAYHVFREKLGGGYGTHWMRKTFAQEIFRYFLKENPADPMRALELTRRALGHARLDTTVKYLGINETNLEKAQNEIFGKIF